MMINIPVVFYTFLQILRFKDVVCDCAGLSFYENMNMCTDQTLTGRKNAVINLSKVPKSEQLVCECTLTTISKETGFRYTFYKGVNSHGFQFDVNGNEVPVAQERRIHAKTPQSITVRFSADENSTWDNACIFLRGEDEFLFDGKCSAPTTISTGLIVGLVIGIVLLIAASVVVFIYVRRKYKCKKGGCRRILKALRSVAEEVMEKEEQTGTNVNEMLNVQRDEINQQLEELGGDEGMNETAVDPNKLEMLNEQRDEISQQLEELGGDKGMNETEVDPNKLEMSNEQRDKINQQLGADSQEMNEDAILD